MDGQWYIRMALYVLTPVLVLLLREKEGMLTLVLLGVFAGLAYGRSWGTVGGVLVFGGAMAALEALCIQHGMWKYFRVGGIVPTWLPILWAITILFVWAVQPIVNQV